MIVVTLCVVVAVVAYLWLVVYLIRLGARIQRRLDEEHLAAERERLDDQGRLIRWTRPL